MPVNDFGVGGAVADGDGSGSALAHAEERAGHLVVVGEGADVVFRGGFEEVGSELEGDVGGGDGEEVVPVEDRAGGEGGELGEATARDHLCGSLRWWASGLLISC